MASNLNWNPVSVNFSDASALMRNAGDSISKAGTVFGELRKSILDEEQRAIENAYKEKVFEEGMRQFNERIGFDKSKWEDEKIFKQDESKRDWSKINEDIRFHNLTAAHQRDLLGLQRQEFGLKAAEANRKWGMEDRAIAVAKQIFQDEEADRADRDAYNNLRNEALAPLALQMGVSKQKIDEANAVLSNPEATDADRQMAQQVLQYHTGVIENGKTQANNFDAMYQPTYRTPLGQSPYVQQRFWRARYAEAGLPLGLPTPADSLTDTDAKIAIKRAEAETDWNNEEQKLKLKHNFTNAENAFKANIEGSYKENPRLKNLGEEDLNNLNTIYYVYNNLIYPNVKNAPKLSRSQIADAYLGRYRATSWPFADTKTTGKFGAADTYDIDSFNLRSFFDPRIQSNQLNFYRSLIVPK